MSSPILAFLRLWSNTYTLKGSLKYNFKIDIQQLKLREGRFVACVWIQIKLNTPLETSKKIHLAESIVCVLRAKVGIWVGKLLVGMIALKLQKLGFKNRAADR